MDFISWKYLQGECLEKMSVGMWKDLLIAYEKDVSSLTVPSSCGMAEKLRWAMPSIAGVGVAGMQIHGCGSRGTTKAGKHGS